MKELSKMKKRKCNISVTCVKVPKHGKVSNKNLCIIKRRKENSLALSTYKLHLRYSKSTTTFIVSKLLQNKFGHLKQKQKRPS